MVSDGGRDVIRETIERAVREGRLSAEAGAELLTRAAVLSAELSARAITDPATWEAARELIRSSAELSDRLYAGEISREQYGRELNALLETADADTLEAAHRLQGAIAQALKRGPGPTEA